MADGMSGSNMGGSGMRSQSTSTGMTGSAGMPVSNPDYNLISILYHRLQEGETLRQYIDDAKSAGENDLASFFQELQNEDKQRAERASNLLKHHLEMHSKNGGTGSGSRSTGSSG